MFERERIEPGLVEPVGAAVIDLGESRVGLEWRAGWRLLAASAIGVATTFILFQAAAGLLIAPMQAEFHWSRSAVAIGPLSALVMTPFLPLSGVLVDRYGPRLCTLVGSVLFATGLVALALVGPQPILFYGTVTYLAVVGLFANSIVFSKGLATRFHARMGTAVGLMMGLSSFICAIEIPPLAALTTHWGWRAGVYGVAALLLLIGLPVVWFWFRPAGPGAKAGPDESVLAGATVAQALVDRRFWLLAAGLGLAALAVGGALAHLQPALRGLAFAPADAAFIGAFYLAATGGGRILVGLLLDRLRPALVAGAALFCAAIGMALFITLPAPRAHPAWVGVSVVMIGLGQGAESDFMAFFVLKLFGVRSFSRLLGIIAMVVSGGMAFGGILFARLFDAYGDYDLAFELGSALFAAGACLVALVRTGPIRKRSKYLI